MKKHVLLERVQKRGSKYQATSNFCTDSKYMTLYFMDAKKLVFPKYFKSLEGQLKNTWKLGCPRMYMAPGPISQCPITCYLSFYVQSSSFKALTSSSEQMSSKYDSSQNLSLFANWLLDSLRCLIYSASKKIMGQDKLREISSSIVVVEQDKNRTESSW